MKVIDPGHTYLLDAYDGGDPSYLIFMKREGEGYPGNEGHYPGTNIQEVLRAVMDRLYYLDNQIPCEQNKACQTYINSAIWELEDRASKRHGLHTLPKCCHFWQEPTCKQCGHVVCKHKGDTI